MLVKVTVSDFDPTKFEMKYRVSCDKFQTEMRLQDANITLATDLSDKLKESGSAFFSALSEAFYEFCESDSNRDKLSFDFYFNGK